MNPGLSESQHSCYSKTGCKSACTKRRGTVIKRALCVRELNKPLQLGKAGERQRSRENLLCRSVAYELADAKLSNELPFLHCDVFHHCNAYKGEKEKPLSML